MAKADVLYQTMSNGFRTDLWNSSRRCDQKVCLLEYMSRLTGSSVVYDDPYMNGSSYGVPAAVSTAGPIGRIEPAYSSSPTYNSRPISATYSNSTANFGSYGGPSPSGWEARGSYSPHDSLDDLVVSPNGLDGEMGSSAAGSSARNSGKGRPQRRPSNRDEFDGPHQFLKRPHPEYIASQERELPHLPTHLLVQEQDHILTQVNDRLSQCAFDFVAKYQFPIPLTQDVRPVERPSDREWTEWVYLLKRLATKRRIPARVLYNGQIKQFVTILENSLEMRHAAKHQSRPLKDDRNILQLISAGIQVAKILKDAAAMDFLDHLYVSTQRQIDERSAAAHARFR
ncbi:hypothetical protein PG993_001233 [Apiospora rasikravindrae]|uniref:Uncharacterized protein n=1 Tax=Apiospora rasikravindrae TaxID=990691 RepID=A0ABR1UAT4_9PEZI